MIEGARGGGGREDLADECTLQVLGNWINTKQEKRNSSPLFWRVRAQKYLFFKAKTKKDIIWFKKIYDPIQVRLNSYLITFNVWKH